MTRMSLVELKSNLSEVINRIAVGNERVVVTRGRKGLAALVPVEDLKTLRKLEDRVDLAEAARALDDFKRSRRRSVAIEDLCRR